jgi:hypothetical protein
LGGAVLRHPEEARTYSEKTASQIDEAVRKLLERAHEKASAILQQNRELLDQTAEKLLARETLTAEDLPKSVLFVTDSGASAEPRWRCGKGPDRTEGFLSDCRRVAACLRALR